MLKIQEDVKLIAGTMPAEGGPKRTYDDVEALIKLRQQADAQVIRSGSVVLRPAALSAPQGDDAKAEPADGSVVPQSTAQQGTRSSPQTAPGQQKDDDESMEPDWNPSGEEGNDNEEQDEYYSDSDSEIGDTPWFS